MIAALLLLAQVASSTTALDEVVVSATRDPRARRDVPPSTSVIDRRRIELSAGVTSDQVLRLAPSAATFRRSSSLVSDPSAQGVNLRGLAPSAVSRALVLDDGVPVNDGFGGSVYWRSVPRIGLQRIELTPSGGSALYGNAALGGVVQLIPRSIDGRSLEGEISLGTFDTFDVAGRITERFGPVGAAIEAELLRSAGHPVVAESDRGAIDRDTPSLHGSINGRAEIAASEDLDLIVRGGWFREDQSGGTRFTEAGVELASWGGRARLTLGADRLELSIFGRDQRFTQRRARIGAQRSVEALAATQDVPSDDQGLSLSWRRPNVELGGRHTFSAGIDLRRIYGESREELTPQEGPVFRRVAGGEQYFSGLFLQDLFAPTASIEVMAALRADLWRNVAGRRLVRGSETRFEDRSRIELSPKLGVRYRAIEPLTFRASIYRAFRAPTLNELYRPFQVGTILTAANPELEAEHLNGLEAGFEVDGAFFAARLMGFWNFLSRPISNVTLAELLPDGSQRQRQNLGAAEVRGFELELDVTLGGGFWLEAAYTLAQARVTEHPELAGKALPQDPLHRATFALIFDDPRILQVNLQLRIIGPQFEDDRNTLKMDGVALIDLFVARRIMGRLDLFAAAENVLDAEYLVGRAGVDTIGSPFMLRIGLRLR